MKGNVCMGIVLKCSRSRMSHLIFPERKESESNEKRGKAAAAKSGGAVVAKRAGGEAEIGHCREQKQQDDGE